MSNRAASVSVRVGGTFKGHDGSDDGPIATPAIDGAEVFAAGPHGHLLALDVSTGKVRWRHDLVAEFGAAVPAYGFAASPLVERDLVIVPTGGPGSRGLLAFNRTNGRLVWNAPHAKTLAYASAVAAEIGDVRQIVVGRAAPGPRLAGRLLRNAPHARVRPGCHVGDRAHRRRRAHLPAQSA